MTLAPVVVPNVVALSMATIPVMYTAGFAFSDLNAAKSAISALPMLSRTAANTGRLQGRTVAGPSGYYEHVRAPDYSSIRESGMVGAAKYVSETVLPSLDEGFADEGKASEWRYEVRGENVQRLFGEGSVFGELEIILERRPFQTQTGAAVGRPANDVDTAATDGYILSIRELFPTGERTSDRVETSLAALLGLKRGHYGIGVQANVEREVGFGRTPTDKKVDAIPLRRYLYALDGLLNTDRVEAGVVASAFYMGSQYLDLGPVASEFEDAVFFGSAVISLSPEVNVPINFGLRLRNLKPVSIRLTQKGWNESGLLLVEGVEPGRPSGVELILVPRGGLTFSDMDIEVMHEVAKKSREQLRQGLL